ncbi:MAG TPA: virulence factor Mce family protein [Mycobacterium sp.]
MSTIFDIHNLRLPKMSPVTVIAGSLAVVAALVGAFVGRSLYQKATTNSVVAYFSETNAIYAGDKVQIMGAPVGSIDKIEPAGDKMKVTFHYANRYKVPVDAAAVILNPTLVASRNIQLEPPYDGGPVLADHAVIPIERTAVPVEWDTLRNDITDIVMKLGPTPEQPKGPFGDIIESFADGLAGKGTEINATLDGLSRALTALNKGRGDFFGVLRNLALFVKALHKNDQQFVALNKDLAGFTTSLAGSDRNLAHAIEEFDGLLATARPFFAKNRAVLAHDVNSLADVTTALVQPEPLDGLERFFHVAPTALANVNNIYHPAQGAITGFLAFPNFANPMQFICSAIQAGSRLGYQESAELCAEYLAPVADAIKFNYFPFGVNAFNTAYTTPKEIAYSEPRLQPPPGYKDTTVPGIWVPDTPLSHRNTQPGWIVAPGMQGVKPGKDTARLLTPESLAELMGGPDIEPIQSQYQTPPGPPNSYDEVPAGPFPNVGLPINPAAIPPPAPGPAVIPGPVAPVPAPVAGPGA